MAPSASFNMESIQICTIKPYERENFLLSSLFKTLGHREGYGRKELSLQCRVSVDRRESERDSNSEEEQQKEGSRMKVWYRLEARVTLDYTAISGGCLEEDGEKKTGLNYLVLELLLSSVAY